MASVIQRSFASGELAPGLAARADLARYLSGLRVCRNFLVRQHGGVENRPGTRRVATAKTTGETFLQPFVFAAADDSYIIECGELYFRFHHNGAPVLLAGVPYEIVTPYHVSDFKPPAPACFNQSGAIITITHLNHAPAELLKITGDNWTLTPIVTGPAILPPATPAGTAGAVGTRTFAYVVSAAAAATYEESNPSVVATVTAAADPTPTAPIVLTWAPVAGAVEYYVYGDPFENGTFGYLGVATGIAEFRDVGQVPDFNLTPQIPRVLFAAPLEYPAQACTYGQRRLFAGTHTDRELVFASQVGYPHNFAIRSPLQDDDAVTLKIASDRIQPVVHMLGITQGLVVLTDSGEWLIDGDKNGLTPSSPHPLQHGAVGASFTPPVVIGGSVLFVQARGTTMRDLRFDREVQGLSGRDLCLWSSHLFKKKTLVDTAFAHVPHSIVWCVRSDGVLLGLTYVPEEDVWGWHRHDTDGAFEQVCTIPEGDEDAVYVVVRRTINGVVGRYIERFASRQFEAPADAVFVDAAVTYTGTPTTAVAGLLHLRGKVVSVLADGRSVGPLTVSATGTITLAAAASTIHVGLPIVAELQTLDLDVQGSGVRDKRKLVKGLSVLLEDSDRGFLAGTTAATLLEVRAEPWEAAGLVTGLVQINLTAGFTEAGRVLIRHTAPLPLTILGLIPDVQVGG